MKAIGLNSGTVYAEGKRKRDVMRQLHARYPSAKTIDTGSHEHQVKRVYPEAIKIF